MSDKRIKLAVLVDSRNVPHYTSELIKELRSHTELELVAIVAHNRTSLWRLWFLEGQSVRSILRYWLAHRLLNRIAVYLVMQLETILLRVMQRPSIQFNTEYLREYNIRFLTLSPILDVEKGQCHYAQADLREIEALSIDYLINESKWNTIGVLENRCAHKGVIKLQLGGSPFTPRNEAGFREVCRFEPTTPFSIKCQTSSSETSIYSGAFQTHASLVINRDELIRKAYPYLAHAVLLHSRYSSFSRTQIPADWMSNPASTPCPNEGLTTIVELATSLCRRIVRACVFCFKHGAGWRDRWQVYWYRGHWQDSTTMSGVVVDNAINSYLADPFVINRNGRQICFVEEYNYHRGYGVISAIEFTAHSSVQLGVVLEENFHLSFPFIFEYQSDLYMCPESNQSGDIRLYKCVSFPLVWSYWSTLQKDVKAADTMIVEHGQRWWMFTNIDPQGTNDFVSRLYLFWSDNPLSDCWTPHPQNPVVFDPLRARNGGFIRDGDRLFRCAQRQGFQRYGEGLTIQEIVHLSTTEYSEKMVKTINPATFGAKGTHHMDYKNGITVFDVLRFQSIKK